MSGHIDNLGYFATRLPRALAVVDRQGRGATEGEVEESIETLQALADYSLRQIGSPGMETTLPVGGRGYGAAGSVIGINPDDDGAVISHLNNALATGVFTATPPGREDRAGSPLPSSRIPAEDRGRTAYVVAPAGDAVVGNDPLPPIPGLSPAIMQWLPVAMWSVRKLGQLIKQWRNR